MDRLAIEQDAVLVLAVLAEPLAVVREEDDDRPVVDAEALQLVQQVADDPIGRGHLAVVLLGIARGEGLRRLVGGVRLVDVEEEEKGLLRRGAQPVERQPQGLGPRPLEAAEAAAGLELDAVLVEIEAGPQPVLPLEHIGRHRAARGIPLPFQDLRQERQLALLDPRAVEVVADVVAHAVVGRLEAGQQGRVGRERERSRRIGVLEKDGVAPQGIDRRGLHTLVAIGRQVVGTQGVDGDDDDGRALRDIGCGAGLGGAGGEEEQEEEGVAEPRTLTPRPPLPSALPSTGRGGEKTKKRVQSAFAPPLPGGRE